VRGGETHPVACEMRMRIHVRARLMVVSVTMASQLHFMMLHSANFWSERFGHVGMDVLYPMHVASTSSGPSGDASWLRCRGVSSSFILYERGWTPAPEDSVTLMDMSPHKQLHKYCRRDTGCACISSSSCLLSCTGRAE
jgi:hypothetical protein